LSGEHFYPESSIVDLWLSYFNLSAVPLKVMYILFFDPTNFRTDHFNYKYSSKG
jgi:hypothetical protein